jgi:hypothetical protein
LGRPAIANSPFAGEAQTFAVINAKIILSIRNRDLFSLVDVTHGQNRHAFVSTRCQAPVCITVVIGKAGRAQEERWGFTPTRHHDTEVFAGQSKIHLLFTGHRHECSTQVFDLFALFDEPAGTYRSFMLRDNVSVGGGDLERTVWEIHLDVFAEMSTKPFFFAGTVEICQVFFKS